MTRRLDDWQKAAIDKMLHDGKSQKEIAVSVGTSAQTVNAYAKRLYKKNTEQTNRRLAEIKHHDSRNWEITLVNRPTEESIQTDIMTLYRQTLHELSLRLPSMSDNEVYQLSMSLLRNLNNETES